MADKPKVLRTRPKREEAAVQAGLQLLSDEKEKNWRKASHFRMVKIDSKRITHTPHRSRRKTATKAKGINFLDIYQQYHILILYLFK